MDKQFVLARVAPRVSVALARDIHTMRPVLWRVLALVSVMIFVCACGIRNAADLQQGDSVIVTDGNRAYRVLLTHCGPRSVTFLVYDGKTTSTENIALGQRVGGLGSSDAPVQFQVRSGSGGDWYLSLGTSWRIPLFPISTDTVSLIAPKKLRFASVEHSGAQGAPPIAPK